MKLGDILVVIDFLPLFDWQPNSLIGGKILNLAFAMMLLSDFYSSMLRPFGMTVSNYSVPRIKTSDTLIAH